MSWSDGLAILGGLAAGVLSGFIGIGGGTAFVPIMTVGFRFNQALAQGTSLAAIIPTAIVGGVTHVREGNVLLGPALWMRAARARSLDGWGRGRRRDSGGVARGSRSRPDPGPGLGRIPGPDSAAAESGCVEEGEGRQSLATQLKPR